MKENDNGIGGITAQDRPIQKKEEVLSVAEAQAKKREDIDKEQALKPKVAGPPEVTVGTTTVNDHEKRLWAIEKKLNLRP